MKKTIALILCAMMLLPLLTACGGSSAPASTAAAPTAAPAVEYPWAFVKNNAGIDDLKTTVCDQTGTVVTITYETPAYAVNDIFGANETLTKSADIYLPYGYDESKQYNVLYLLHGTTGENDGPMHAFWLEQWGKYTLPVLDNMIKNGLCDPLIIVCPNYYSYVDGYTIGDAEAKALAEKQSDSFIWTEVAETGGEADNAQNVWPVYFGQELRNNLIPAVETAYATYAKGDVSDQNLIATREHRAFAGLSRGSMTVTRAGMMTNTDIIAWFGNYSGIWADFDKFQAAMEGFKEYPVKFWYNGNGKGDFALENHQAFVEQALSKMGDTFKDGENYAWVRLKDGAHMYNSWVVDLYNSLLVFFK